MRNPNGYGTIRKLTGKRKRPFGVYVTTGYETYHAVPSIDFLEDILSETLYEEVRAEYDAYVARQPSKRKQVQKCIGYYATRQAAMIALAEYNKNPLDMDKMEITFEQVYDAIYERTIKDMKVSTKRSYVTAYDKCAALRSMRMRDIRLAHLQRVVDQHDDKSKSTQNNIIVLFHTMYKFCLENDLCEKDYSRFVRVTSKIESKQKKPFSKEGKKISYANYKQLFFCDFMSRFGMNHTPHECRHTFATIGAASGLNPVLLKKIIGHASSDITEGVYTHAYIEDLVKEIDKFKV